MTINPRIFQALAVKAALKLHTKGMKHSKLSLKDILCTASIITGKEYKGKKDILQACADLDTWVMEANDVLKRHPQSAHNR